MSGLDRDVVFVALTRPQTFAGVTYSVVVLNAVVTTELFLLFKSPWVLAAALVFHAAGWIRTCSGLEPDDWGASAASTARCACSTVRPGRRRAARSSPSRSAIGNHPSV